MIQNQPVCTGRPVSLAGRLPKECRTYDFLDRLGIAYQRLDHEALATMEACQEAEAILGAPICKNLFLRNAQKTSFYLLLLSGEKKFRTALLSKQIGSARLSFAETEFMEQFLDITPGSVSVLGLMNDPEKRVRLLIDQDLLKQPFFCCHPCINTSTLRFTTENLVNILLPALGHPHTLVELP